MAAATSRRSFARTAQGPRPPARQPPHRQLPAPPAAITVVTTAVGLQDAVMAGALDIEIRAHLDLGQLERLPLPLPREQTTAGQREHTQQPSQIQPSLALMYATEQPRSIRGNCSAGDPAAALGLSAADTADLLPLKPFQCMLIMHHSWLLVRNASVWVDNLYLRRKPRGASPLSDFSFLSVGADSVVRSTEPVSRAASVYVTNTTFQANYIATAGVMAEHKDCSIYIDGCVFSDWAGYHSPLTILRSAADIRNTVFRSMRLPVELADVSFDGTVRFSNVSLANVTLQAGAVVSTTINDYTSNGVWSISTFPVPGCGRVYLYPPGTATYPEDDEAYDVPLEPVPAADRGAFCEEFRIRSAAMSDCTNALVFARRGAWRPGCPAAAEVVRKQAYARSLACAAAQAPGEADNAHGGGYLPMEDEYVPDDFLLDIGESYYDREPGRVIGPDDPWLSALRAALPAHRPTPDEWPPYILPNPCPPLLPPPPRLQPPFSAADALMQPSSPQSSSPAMTPSGGTIAGITTAAIALSAATAIMLWFVFRRFRHHRAAARTSYIKHVELAEGGAMAGVGWEPCQSAEPPVNARALQRQQQRRVAVVMQQLDTFRDGAELLLGRFELLPRGTCMHGSHTVVQPTFDDEVGSPHVVKLFLSVAAFRAEATLLAAFLPDLRMHLSPAAAAAAAAAARAAPESAPPADTFLPEVHKLVENADGRLRVGGGRRLPPMLVMAKGQSLLEWSARGPPDPFLELAMLSSIAQRLACLHDAGYVHCNLKPSKVLLMDATRRWSVAGFSRAARTGTDVPVNFTLTYAAPEVVRAFVAGQRSAPAEQSMDTWALGVIAFETLSGVSAFDLAAGGQAQVVAQLHGERPLPWEGPGSDTVLRKLGMLRVAVLRLLERNPAQRATARQFHTACSDAFSQHTGRGL